MLSPIVNYEDVGQNVMPRKERLFKYAQFFIDSVRPVYAFFYDTPLFQSVPNTDTRDIKVV